jgi:hypothetical protein
LGQEFAGQFLSTGAWAKRWQVRGFIIVHNSRFSQALRVSDVEIGGLHANPSFMTLNSDLYIYKNLRSRSPVIEDSSV